MSFVRLSSLKTWFSIVIVASLLLSAFVVCTDDEEEGSGSDEIDDEGGDPRKGQLPATKDLCQNVISCTCNGKHEEAECSNCISKLYFSHFRIPPTITSIRIKKCPFVSIDHTTLEKLNIKLLHISQVDHLQVMANNLRIVDRLIVEHVHHLENIEAFDNIEADTVEFKHVTFPVKTELKPLAIKSDLKFAHCNLTDVTITVNQKTEDQSVIINHCSLDRVKMKINTADFNMTGNLFVDLQSTNPGLMDVEYSRSLTLRNNRFGKTAPTVMPDVRSSNQTLVFNVSSSGLSNDSSIWLNHFKFLFTGSKIVNGTTEKSLDNHNKKNHSACEEHNMAGSTSQKILACSTTRMLEDYFKSGQKSEKSKPSKPEQQTQPRMKVSSGVTTANQSLGAYLVTGIMIFHRVSSHF